MTFSPHFIKKNNNFELHHLYFLNCVFLKFSLLMNVIFVACYIIYQIKQNQGQLGEIIDARKNSVVKFPKKTNYSNRQGRNFTNFFGGAKKIFFAQKGVYH